MNQVERIAAFLDKYARIFGMPSVGSGDPYVFAPAICGYDALARPSTEVLGWQMMRDVEFEALRLGVWTFTPEGQLLTTAVELMATPLYRDDIELLVGALRYAAGEKRKGNRKEELVFLACAAALLLVMFVGLAE